MNLKKNDLVTTNVYNERVFVISGIRQGIEKCFIYDYKTKQRMGEWSNDQLTKLQKEDYPEYFIWATHILRIKMT